MTALPVLYRPDPGSVDRYRMPNGARLSPATQDKYKRELRAAAEAGVNLSDSIGLQEYADTLPVSRRIIFYASLKAATNAIETAIMARATAEDVPEIQARLWRLQALRKQLHQPAPKGTHAHTWLTAEQVTTLTNNCKPDNAGRRDWIVLAILVGAGLRREELAALTFDDLKTQGKRYVLQVEHGKGDKARVVPIQPMLAGQVRAWQHLCTGGHVARRIHKTGKILTAGLDPSSIFRIVRRYGAIIGVPDLAPHDLRRTFAMLAYNDGVPLDQISLSLGHSSEKTTRIYLNIELNLEVACSDSVPLSPFQM